MAHIDSFTALADPTRRQIIALLHSAEQQGNVVVAALHIPQPGVSRHPRSLLDAGFVRVRPEGQRRYYALRAEPFRELDTWLADYRDLWEARLDRFDKALARKRSRKTPKATEQDT